MHANFEKRKVPQAGSGNFALKWLFYKIYALYNIYSFICGLSFWKTRVKIHIYKENLLNFFFYYYNFTPNISNWYIKVLLFLVGNRKINKIYQGKLKSADRLWALEIIH